MDKTEVVATFLIGLITAFVLLYVHRKNREVAQESIKISCLTLMAELAEQRAYSKERLKFIVEETFKRYYGRYIPIEVIRKICVHKNASYAFLAYTKISCLMLYDEETQKFNILSKTARVIRFLALLQLGLLMLCFSGAIIAIVFLSITKAQAMLSVAEHIIFLILGGLSGLCFWTFFFILNRCLNEFENLKKMKFELQDDVDETLTRKSDKWIFGLLFVFFIVIISLLIIYQDNLI